MHCYLFYVPNFEIRLNFLTKLVEIIKFNFYFLKPVVLINYIFDTVNVVVNNLKKVVVFQITEKD